MKYFECQGGDQKEQLKCCFPLFECDSCLHFLLHFFCRMVLLLLVVVGIGVNFFSYYLFSSLYLLQGQFRLMDVPCLNSDST